MDFIYETMGGAAAALLGLLFVSVSVRAEQILGARHSHARRIAEQAFQNYLAVLMVSLVSLMPNVGTISLGFTLLYMLGIWAAWVVIRLHQTLMNWRAERTRLLTLRRYIASIGGFGTLILCRCLSGAWSRRLPWLGADRRSDFTGFGDGRVVGTAGQRRARAGTSRPGR